MSENKVEPGISAIGISVSAQVSENRSVVLQTHVPQDMDIDLLHKLMDKLEATVARQQLHHEVIIWEADLEKRLVTFQDLQEDFARLDATHLSSEGSTSTRGKAVFDAKLSKHNADRDNVLVTVAHHKKNLVRVEEGLALRKARLNGTSGTTDSHSSHPSS